MTGRTTKKPSATDQHIGQRIKARRTTLGISQTGLGQALGVTFQQIQKYEKGTNRIGGGRLSEIGNALGVPVSYFYNGLEEGRQRSQNPVAEWLDTAEAVAVARAVVEVPSGPLRKSFVAAVEKMAAGFTEAALELQKPPRRTNKAA